MIDAVFLDPRDQTLAFLLLLVVLRHLACVEATCGLHSGPGKGGTFLQTFGSTTGWLWPLALNMTDWSSQSQISGLKSC